MSKNRTNTYQSRFIRLALRWLPHHVALSFAAKHHSTWLLDRLNSYARKHIIGTLELRTFPSDNIEHYNKMTRHAVLWHGTGRYQHTKAQKTDVLESILKKGSIQPVEDSYAIFSSGTSMRSISLTPLRIIARSYADIHGKGHRERHRYGNALTWTSYHYGLFYARLYTIQYHKIRRYYKTWHSLTHDKNGHNTWGKKVNTNAEDVWDVFGLGSDITGNYPILFGIKELHDTIPLSAVFRDYEVRVSNPIALKDVTHIEVPESKIKEVKNVVSRFHFSIPVVAIELAEVAASEKSFSTLLGFTDK